MQGAVSISTLVPLTHINRHLCSASSGQRRQADVSDTSAKRVRAEGLSPTSSSSGSAASPQTELVEELANVPELDESMTMELVNCEWPSSLAFRQVSLNVKQCSSPTAIPTDLYFTSRLSQQH